MREKNELPAANCGAMHNERLNRKNWYGNGMVVCPEGSQKHEIPKGPQRNDNNNIGLLIVMYFDITGQHDSYQAHAHRTTPPRIIHTSVFRFAFFRQRRYIIVSRSSPVLLLCETINCDNYYSNAKFLRMYFAVQIAPEFSTPSTIR